jgi:hypothetical protein
MDESLPLQFHLLRRFGFLVVNLGNEPKSAFWKIRWTGIFPAHNVEFMKHEWLQNPQSFGGLTGNTHYEF